MKGRNFAAEVDKLSEDEFEELTRRLRTEALISGLPQAVPLPEAKDAAQQRLLSTVEKKRKELGLDACQVDLPEAA